MEGQMRESVEDEQASATSATGLSVHARRAWKRVVRFERQWSALGPTVFAVVAGVLLVYNHVQQQVTDLVFWLGLALIASVFTWMLQNNRRQSRLEAVTGLANRLQLRDDLADMLALSNDRRTLVLLELEGLAAYRDRFGFEAGDELLRRFARELTSVVDYLGGTAYRVDGGQFCALLPTGERQPGEIMMAISVSADNDDDETPINRPHGEVTLPDDASDPDLALQIAGRRLAAHKQRQRRSAKRQAHDVLVAVLSARRPELQAHLRAVAFRAIAIGRLLGLGQGQLDDVVSAARLQNIGLLSVPDAVLDKPSSLSPTESELIRGHASAGAGIISSAPALASVAALVRSSCEHFDGSGYPDSLAGEAIPLGSRIVAVCVAFTALTSKRPYRPARTPEEALAVLRSCAGTQFDPRVVEALAEDLADEVSPPRLGEPDEVGNPQRAAVLSTAGPTR
jgi:HD-GYP domain-containing protein (c-di-GMP phosphodiesterase class II)